MNIPRFFLCLVFLASPALAEDTSIADIARSLTPIIRKYFPAATIEVSSTEYVAKHGTMAFTVHGRGMTGEVSPTTHVTEGPNYEGFMLRIGLHDGPYRGQADIPQRLNEPYWTTFLDAAPVPDRNQHLMTGLSVGNRLNEEFKKAVLKALPKSHQ